MNSGTDRNVVIVTVDSLRADHCGFLGCEYDTTPNLDDLASDGVVYENVIAPGPRTPSSMPVVFTGEDLNTPPVSLSQWRDRRKRIGRHLERFETIAERFKDRGYDTGGLTVNPWTTRDTGFDAGFDQFVQSPDQDKPWPVSIRIIDRLIKLAGYEDKFSWQYKRDWLVQWTHYYNQIKRMASSLQEPYFIWIFLLDTHQPYLAPPKYRVETSAIGMYYAALQYWNHIYRGRQQTLPRHVQTLVKRSYRDSVRSVDGFVNRLYSDLASTDPIFIVHSDHGEAFGDHETYGHQQQLFEENLHIPLLLLNVDQSTRINDPLSLKCLPEIAVAASQDRVTSVNSEIIASRTEDEGSFSLRLSQWKYLNQEHHELLFNLSSDPEERINQLERNPTLTESFRQMSKSTQSDLKEKRQISKIVQTLPYEADP